MRRFLGLILAREGKKEKKEDATISGKAKKEKEIWGFCFTALPRHTEEEGSTALGWSQGGGGEEGKKERCPWWCSS